MEVQFSIRHIKLREKIKKSDMIAGNTQTTQTLVQNVTGTSTRSNVVSPPHQPVRYLLHR